MAKSTSRSLYIDQSSAELAVVKLTKTVDGLEKAIAKGNKAGKDMSASITKLGETKTALKSVQDQIDKGLKPSFQQTQAQVTKLRNELKRMSEDAPGYAAKFKEYSKASAHFDTLKQKINGVQKAQDEMSGGFGRVFSRVAQYATAYLAFDSIKNAIAGVVSFRAELETSLANLSSITGATGDDLEFLKQSSIDLSKEGGNSAVEFVEAIKLIASAKPELLDAKEDLIEVTKAAKLLAEASGLTLPDAATRLTDALNQYGEPAQEATRYVDALAASAKFGAAEVPELTEALLKFGSQAKSNNIDIYESAAAIELLAEKGLKGADAGTALRNIFIKLSGAEVLPKEALAELEAAGVSTEILTNKNLSLEKRLQEFSKIQNNTNALIKVFGSENLNAGQIVLQNVGRYAQLTGQLKEQGVAATQAAANTNTLAAKWEKFKNVVMSIFAEGNNNWLKSGIDFLTRGATGLGNVIDRITVTATYNIQQLQSLYGLAKSLATFDGKGVNENFNNFRNNKPGQTRLEKEKNLKVTNPLDEIQKSAESSQRARQAAEAKRKADELQAEAERKQREAEAAEARKKAGAVEAKASAEKRKQLAEEGRRALVEYNNFAKEINRAIEDLMSSDGTKKWNAVIRETEDELDKINKLAVSHLQKQELINLVLEKQRAKFKQIVIDEATVKEDIDKAIGLAIATDQQSKVKVSLLPVVEEEDLEAAREKFQQLMNDVQDGLNFAGQLTDTFMQFADAKANRENAELNKELRQNDIRREGIRNLERTRVLSSQEAKRQLAAIDAQEDKKREALEKKQFERTKKLQIAQAFINGALGITSVLAAIPGPLDLLSLGVSRYIAIGLNIATTAAAIAKISSTKYAKGGKMEGPSHSEGGMPIINPRTGAKIAEIEGGEYVLSKQTVANNREIADALLDASLNRGGMRIRQFWETRPYKAMNYTALAQTMQKVKFATGGVMPTAGAAPEATSIKSDPAIIEALQQSQQINAALFSTINNLNAQLSSGIKANLSYFQIKETEETINRINEAAGMKP